MRRQAPLIVRRVRLGWIPPDPLIKGPVSTKIYLQISWRIKAGFLALSSRISKEVYHSPHHHSPTGCTCIPGIGIFTGLCKEEMFEKKSERFVLFLRSGQGEMLHDFDHECDPGRIFPGDPTVE